MAKKSWPSPEAKPKRAPQPQRAAAPKSSPPISAPQRTSQVVDQQARLQQEQALARERDAARAKQAELFAQQRAEELRIMQARRDETLRQQQLQDQAARARIQQEALTEQQRAQRLQALNEQRAAEQRAEQQRIVQQRTDEQTALLKRQQDDARKVETDAQRERDVLTKVADLMEKADEAQLTKRSDELFADMLKRWNIPPDTASTSPLTEPPPDTPMTNAAYIAALEKLGALSGVATADKQTQLNRGIEQFANYIKYIRGINAEFKKPSDEQYGALAQLLGIDKQTLLKADGGVSSIPVMRRVAEISARVEAFQQFYNQTNNPDKPVLPVNGIPEAATMQKMIAAEVLPAALGVPQIASEESGADTSSDNKQDNAAPDAKKKTPVKPTPVNDALADSAYVTLPMAAAVPLAGLYAMRNQVKRMVPEAIRNLAGRATDALPPRYKTPAKIGLATIASIFGADYLAFGKDSLAGAALAKSKGEPLTPSTGEEYKTLGIVHGVSATVIGAGVLGTHVKKHMANKALKDMPAGALKDIAANAKAAGVEPRTALDKLKSSLGRTQIGKLVGLGLAGWGSWKIYESQQAKAADEQSQPQTPAKPENRFLQAYNYVKGGIKDFSTGIIATLAAAGLASDLRKGLKNNTQRTAFGVAATGLLAAGLEVKEAIRNGDRPMENISHGWISTIGAATLISHIAGHNADKTPRKGLSPFTKYALIPALLYSGLHGAKNYLTKPPEPKTDAPTTPVAAKPITAKTIMTDTSDVLSKASMASLVATTVPTLRATAGKAFTPLTIAATVATASEQLSAGNNHGATKALGSGTGTIIGSTALGKTVSSFIAKRVAGAAAGFVGGTVLPVGGNIVGGVLGFFAGDKAVDVAVDAAKAVKQHRQDIMDDRWKSGGEQLTAMLIDKVPVQASPGVLSPKLQAIADAKLAVKTQTEAKEALLLKQKQGQALSPAEIASLAKLDTELQRSQSGLTQAAQRIVKQNFSDGMSPDQARSSLTRELSNAERLQHILTPEPAKITPPPAPPAPVPVATVDEKIDDKIAKGRELAQAHAALKEQSGGVVQTEAEKARLQLAEQTAAASGGITDTVWNAAALIKEKALALVGYPTPAPSATAANTKDDPAKAVPIADAPEPKRAKPVAAA